GVAEGDETVVLTLAGGAGYAVDSPSSATGIIADAPTDVQVMVAVAPAAAAEGGASHLAYTFTRTRSPGRARAGGLPLGGHAALRQRLHPARRGVVDARGGDGRLPPRQRPRDRDRRPRAGQCRRGRRDGRAVGVRGSRLRPQLLLFSHRHDQRSASDGG